jgi:hypothetical protein
MINTRKAKIWVRACLIAAAISTAGAVAPAALATTHCSGGMCTSNVGQVAR